MTTDKYCDCAQGRWPCTCMPRYSMEQQRLSNAWDDATRARELRASAEWLKEIGKCPGQIGVTDVRFGDDPTAALIDKNNRNADEFVRRVQASPELGMPYGEMPEAIRQDAYKLMADGVDAYLAGRAGVPDPYKVAAKAIKAQPGYWQEKAKRVLAAHFEKCAEFDALNARLQVYRGVALIGWAGFILVLLGV